MRDASLCYQCCSPALAGARFCGHCGVSLAVPACASCSGLLPIAARFCGWCGGKVVQAARPSLPLRPDEELRTATILFALIDGLPLLLEERDPEDVKELLDDVMAVLSQQITSHGGVIDKIMADSAMALFGVPSAREDDAPRAVAAALGMVRGVETLNRQIFAERGLRLSLKIGINTGKVVAGFVGGERDRATFTVLGDAVNVASRLEHAAPPGGILIADTTRRLLQQRFRLRTWPALTVKGRDAPLPAHQVIGEADGAPGATVNAQGPVPLVGRAEQLDTLLGLWREVEMYREVRWATLVGELGQGKRRLLDEFVRVAEKGSPAPRVIRMRGVPSFNGEASDLMGVFIHHLASARVSYDQVEYDRLETLARQAIEGKGSPAPSGDAHLGGRFEALIHLVAELAAEAPVLICVDALHDADDLSLDFIEDLATDLPDCAVMILGLSRPDPLRRRRPHWGEGKKRHHTIELGPLSSDETRQLMARLLPSGQDVRPEWAARLYNFTGGNPFYITETVRSLTERGDEQVGADILSVPESIEAVIQSRIDRLSFEEGLTLRAAAVIGDVFWEDAVAAVLGNDRDNDLRRLVEAGFIHRLPHPGLPGQVAYAFSHKLLAQVAYDNLLGDVRRRYHRKTAQWLIARLSTTPGAYRSLVAHHLDHGGEDRLGAQAWFNAAEQAASDFRFTEALTLLDRAAACLARYKKGDAKLGAHIAHTRALCLKGLGRLQEAREGLEAATSRWEALGDEAMASDARLKIGWIALLAGDYASVDTVTTTALAHDTLPPTIRAEALHLRAELSLFRGDEGPVAQLLDEAEALIGEHRDDMRRAAVINSRGKLFDRRAELPAALRTFTAAVQMREALGDIPGLAASLNNLGSVLEAMGDLPGAEICHTRSLIVRRRLEDQWGVAATLLNQASVLLKRGFVGRARRRADKALNIFTQHKSSWGQAEACGELGRALLIAGNTQGAITHLSNAAQQATEMGAPLVESRQRVRLGLARARGGDLTGARVELDRALTLSLGGEHPELECQALLGLLELHILNEDYDDAQDLADEIAWSQAAVHDVALATRLALLDGEASLARGAIDAAIPRLDEALTKAREHDLWPLLVAATEARLRAASDEHPPHSLSPLARMTRDAPSPHGPLLGQARAAVAELFARVEDDDLVASLKKTPAIKRLFEALRG